MLARRVIACLDVRDGQVVKGIHFQNLRASGDPASLARRYNDEGADEIIVLDVSATTEARKTAVETIRAVARTLFVPLAVGGGISELDDAAAMFDAGADKVAINTAALRRPALITEIARRFGSQAVVVSIDARREGDRWGVYARSGSTPARPDAIAWAREAEARGAGEILLTSIDRDGTRQGFDCVLTAAVATDVSIPVIASGGAGSARDFVEVFGAGRADAALAASIFHEELSGIAALKQTLRDAGIPVRLPC